MINTGIFCKGTAGSGHLRWTQVKHRWNDLGNTTQTMGHRRLPGARRPRNKGQEAGSFLSSSAWKVFLPHLDFRIWFLFSPKVCRNLFQWPLEYDTLIPLSAHQWEMAIDLSLLGRTSDSKCPSPDDFLDPQQSLLSLAEVHQAYICLPMPFLHLKTLRNHCLAHALKCFQNWNSVL